ncbi:sulfotransferase [Nocardioides sp. SYSU D00038]|uniref:sulfotransferase n=1 Tax=Nocardioides sp. SYSU D00038 TaxID=2812554 RepID=UPI001966E590|nr:sulfotransferase [Nocardioides sp. SYSU D00038]
MKPPTNPRVLFLAGLGRSGTTLLERTLAEVDGVTALGEVMHLWERGLVRNELCACGEPFLACPFWTAVGERAFGGWASVDPERMAHLKGRVDRASRVPLIARGGDSGFARDVREYVAAYLAVYRAATDLTGDVLVDSSKQSSLAWCLTLAEELDLRVVHCVRDSRGVAHSWAKKVARPEAVDGRDAEMTRYSPALISAMWTLHNATSELLGRRVPAVRLRYEDFVEAPVASTRAVLDLAGVATPASHVAADRVRLGPSHSCAGNPMRFTTGEIPLVRDDQWRSAQATGARRLVTALTAPLLAHYDYVGAGS